MKTKLTLTVEKEVIEQAKIYAKATGISLSEKFQSYLKKITISSEQKVLNELTSQNTKYSGIIDPDWEAAGDKEKSIDFKMRKHLFIPEHLKEIVGCISFDFDYVKDRKKLREMRYSKYLK
jgi:predicted HicB family RNase H-like nuclease